MNNFTIPANAYLKQDISAFYHTDFYGYGRQNNPDYLNMLKNDNHHNWSSGQLNYAVTQLKNVLLTDLPQISQLYNRILTVCVVPRAKADNSYRGNQLLFKSTVKDVVNQLSNFRDGTDYIQRHTNTKTTHLRYPTAYVNDGRTPYQGITNDTCNISNVMGKNILLIDDIYTRTVNIDEDAIQTFLNKGASSVIFYAVARTDESNY